MKKSFGKRRLGLIGLGLLGTALAQRALKSGYAVEGFDLDPTRRGMLDKLGGQSLSSAQEVARRHARILLALPNSAVSARVIQELKSCLKPGTLILDLTTGDPEEMADLGRRLARQRVGYLDATILGSSADVPAGQTLIMAGGRQNDYRKSRALLKCFSQQQFHLGPCGSGARMKLVVNLVLGLNRAALAEGLAFAQASGVSPSRALQVLRAGLAYSRVMDAKGPKMLARDFRPVARLAQHWKDVRLIRALAGRAGLAVPLTAQHEKLLAKVAARGGGELDNSAVILAYD